ncbi:ABC transporter permease [Bradyrhizobium mercantei]|uniref:ABC transporter permease n=1 Tax=Bradyrhizobium mercantei TaxID=1904807 RepID=UPI000976BF05|nr:ABC transporter permease subunit [Bradyrhizobium mercantei]
MINPGQHTLARLRGFIVPLALLSLAEIVYAMNDVHSEIIAPPHEVLRALSTIAMDGTLWNATMQTLAGAMAGLSIGFGLGLLLGAFLGISSFLDRLLFVSIEIVRALPSIAFIPIAMLIFGFGYRMELSIVAFATFWPTLLLTRSAVSSIEPRLLEVSRALGFGIRASIWKIVLPAALPRVFVALRLAASVALIVAVTVEVTANPLGLGYGLMSAQQSLQPATMLALLCWLAAVGWTLNSALLWTEKRLFGRMTSTDFTR